MKFKTRNLFPTHRKRSRSLPTGFSMLELIVVVAILAATALIAIPTLTGIGVTHSDGTVSSPEQVATKATMLAIREALVGENGAIFSMSQNPNAIPRNIHDLVKLEAPDYVQQDAPELQKFNPFRQVGWRGPYVAATGKGQHGEPTVIDGWGNELQLQIDFNGDENVSSIESRYARVVSAGANGVFETPNDSSNMEPGVNQATQLTTAECGDDLILFLQVSDRRK